MRSAVICLATDRMDAAGIRVRCDDTFSKARVARIYSRKETRVYALVELVSSSYAKARGPAIISIVVANILAKLTPSRQLTMIQVDGVLRTTLPANGVLTPDKLVPVHTPNNRPLQENRALIETVVG